MEKLQILEILPVIFIFLIFILYIIWKIRKYGLRETIIKLIVKAENMNISGSYKMEKVIDWLFQLLPFPFNLIITREELKKIVQDIFDEIKIALDCGRSDKQNE